MSTQVGHVNGNARIENEWCFHCDGTRFRLRWRICLVRLGAFAGTSLQILIFLPHALLSRNSEHTPAQYRNTFKSLVAEIGKGYSIRNVGQLIKFRVERLYIRKGSFRGTTEFFVLDSDQRRRSNERLYRS